ncbi:hypothetical protein LTR97_012089 [Elasticomyces elasticus]|uniref:Uncharacterized protein n=1 Tax=Elasticomyces elasticus TaxID=574655 RepID=A0AAN7VL12_9PEZI|nr:hypothetical protein LTR97_012089 [Elasticomyces elasticus]
MTATSNSNELTVELQSLGALYVDSANPTTIIQVSGNPTETRILLEEHAETMSCLNVLGVEDVRLFFFDQNTKKQRHFFTGTIRIAGREVRMYFTDHAADNLLERSQYTGGGQGFLQLLLAGDDKLSTHEFSTTRTLPIHPAENPNSDKSRLLALPKELRAQITQASLIDHEFIMLLGTAPPSPFHNIFGSSLAGGFLALRASRETALHLANKQLRWEMGKQAIEGAIKDQQVRQAEGRSPRIHKCVHNISSDLSFPSAATFKEVNNLLKDITISLRSLQHQYKDAELQIDLVFWDNSAAVDAGTDSGAVAGTDGATVEMPFANGESSQHMNPAYVQKKNKSFAFLLASIHAQTQWYGWEPRIHVVKYVAGDRCIDQQDLQRDTSEFKAPPMTRFLAMQPMIVEGEISTHLFRLVQLGHDGGVRVQSIFRPGPTAWRFVIEPCLHGQAVTRRLLLDQSFSPAISLTESEIVAHELGWDMGASRGLFSRMWYAVKERLEIWALMFAIRKQFVAK